jgi:hypothetical protein
MHTKGTPKLRPATRKRISFGCDCLATKNSGCLAKMLKTGWASAKLERTRMSVLLRAKLALNVMVKFYGPVILGSIREKIPDRLEFYVDELPCFHSPTCPGGYPGSLLLLEQH